MSAFSLSSLKVLVFFALAALMIQCTQFQRIVSILIHGGRLNMKMPSYQYRNPHVKDRLIFNMGIPIPGKDGLWISEWMDNYENESRGFDFFQPVSGFIPHQT